MLNLLQLGIVSSQIPLILTQSDWISAQLDAHATFMSAFDMTYGKDNNRIVSDGVIGPEHLTKATSPDPKTWWDVKTGYFVCYQDAAGSVGGFSWRGGDIKPSTDYLIEVEITDFSNDGSQFKSRDNSIGVYWAVTGLGISKRVVTTTATLEFDAPIIFATVNGTDTVSYFKGYLRMFEVSKLENPDDPLNSKLPPRGVTFQYEQFLPDTKFTDLLKWGSTYCSDSIVDGQYVATLTRDDVSWASVYSEEYREPRFPKYKTGMRVYSRAKVKCVSTTLDSIEIIAHRDGGGYSKTIHEITGAVSDTWYTLEGVITMVHDRPTEALNGSILARSSANFAIGDTIIVDSYEMVSIDDQEEILAAEAKLGRQFTTDELLALLGNVEKTDPDKPIWSRNAHVHEGYENSPFKDYVMSPAKKLVDGVIDPEALYSYSTSMVVTDVGNGYKKFAWTDESRPILAFSGYGTTELFEPDTEYMIVTNVTESNVQTTGDPWYMWLDCLANLDNHIWNSAPVIHSGGNNIGTWKTMCKTRAKCDTWNTVGFFYNGGCYGDLTMKVNIYKVSELEFLGGDETDPDNYVLPPSGQDVKGNHWIGKPSKLNTFSMNEDSGYASYLAPNGVEVPCLSLDGVNAYVTNYPNIADYPITTRDFAVGVIFHTKDALDEGYVFCANTYDHTDAQFGMYYYAATDSFQLKINGTTQNVNNLDPQPNTLYRMLIMRINGRLIVEVNDTEYTNVANTLSLSIPRYFYYGCRHSNSSRTSFIDALLSRFVLYYNGLDGLDRDVVKEAFARVCEVATKDVGYEVVKLNGIDNYMIFDGNGDKQAKVYDIDVWFTDKGTVIPAYLIDARLNTGNGYAFRNVSIDIWTTLGDGALTTLYNKLEVRDLDLTLDNAHFFQRFSGNEQIDLTIVKMEVYDKTDSILYVLRPSSADNGFVDQYGKVYPLEGTVLASQFKRLPLRRIFASFNHITDNASELLTDTGEEWVQSLGTWGRVDNQAYRSALVGRGHCYIESELSDCSVKCDITHTHNSRESGIMFRYVDNDNFWRFGKTNDAQWVLQRCLDGTMSAISSGAHDLATGTHKYEVVLEGSTIQCKIDDTVVHTASNTSFETATKHGLFLWDNYDSGNTTERWNNFEILEK